jgi:hypothetical protein
VILAGVGTGGQGEMAGFGQIFQIGDHVSEKIKEKM